MSEDVGNMSSIQEAIEAMRFCTKKYCIHPGSSSDECEGKIIRAHTIQRNGDLTRIARQGHVYQYDLGMDKLMAPDFKPELKLVGISRATTFTGFCQKHDAEIFRPIEAYDFSGTPQQCFLLAYRAIARETYTKRVQKDLINHQREVIKRHNILAQKSHEAFLDIYEEGVTLGLRDIEYYKSILDKVLLTADFSQVRYYVVVFDRPPDLLVSGSFFFECDFEGNVLQGPEQFSDPGARLHYSCFSLIGTDAGGAGIFSWVGDSDIAERFIASLAGLSDDQIANGIVRFSFEHFENIAVSPQWYDALSSQDKASLLERVRVNLSFDEHRENSYLMDDGRRFVNWRAAHRMSNLASNSARS